MSDTQTAPPPIPPEMVETLSKALAATLAGQTGDTKPLEPVIPPDAPLIGPGLTGGFTVKIEHGDITYVAAVKVPTTEGQPYVFDIHAEKEKVPVGKPYLLFKFVTTSEWSLEISVPPIPIGPVTIEEISVELGMGTVPG